MKNKKLITCCSLIVVAIVVVFFIYYSGARGAGIYTSKSYAGIYDQPYSTNADYTLLATAEPGEKLQVTQVYKDGWAVVNHPEHGKSYTNFFGLTPYKVKFPINVKNFYNGNEAIFMLFQYLLWLIFLIAIVMYYFIMRKNEKAVFITAALLVAAEISYTIIYFVYIMPADVIIQTAFNDPVSIVIAFLINMVGLVILGFAHIRLIKLAYAGVKAPNQSITAKLMTWLLIVFIVLFTAYISIHLIAMALIVAAIIFGLVIGFAFFSFIIDYERSHVTLTQDGSGRWNDGVQEYDVNEARGTARKKRFFDL